MKLDKLLCYVFVSVFGLDRVQTTIDFEMLEQLTNRIVPVKIFNCNVQRIVQVCGPSNINNFCSTIVFMARFHNQSLNYCWKSMLITPVPYPLLSFMKLT